MGFRGCWGGVGGVGWGGGWFFEGAATAVIFALSVTGVLPAFWEGVSVGASGEGVYVGRAGKGRMEGEWGKGVGWGRGGGE